jgi:hypothetical protein
VNEAVGSGSSLASSDSICDSEMKMGIRRGGKRSNERGEEGRLKEKMKESKEIIRSTFLASRRNASCPA